MSEALNNWRKAIDELAQPPAPTAPPCNRDRNSYCQCERKAMMCDGVGPAPTAQPVQQPGAEPVAEVRSGHEGFGLALLGDLPPDGTKLYTQAAPAQRQPLPPSLRRAAEFTRADLGPAGSNYPHVRELLAFAEQAIGITAAPAAQKGEKL